MAHWWRAPRFGSVLFSYSGGKTPGGVSARLFSIRSRAAVRGRAPQSQQFDSSYEEYDALAQSSSFQDDSSEASQSFWNLSRTNAQSQASKYPSHPQNYVGECRKSSTPVTPWACNKRFLLKARQGKRNVPFSWPGSQAPREGMGADANVVQQPLVEPPHHCSWHYEHANTVKLIGVVGAQPVVKRLVRPSIPPSSLCTRHYK